MKHSAGHDLADACKIGFWTVLLVLAILLMH